MEYLKEDKKRLIIHNCTSNEIEILLDNEEKAIKIEANKELEISTLSDRINLTVKEYYGENSEKLRLSEVVLGFIVSIPLFLMNYINLETIDKSIKLPVSFNIPYLDAENEIFINNSAEPLKVCSVMLNGQYVSNEIVYSQEETERQVKEYYKSFTVSLIFPTIIFLAFIIVSICLKSVFSLVVFLTVLCLFSLFIFSIIKKNKKSIKNINNQINK